MAIFSKTNSDKQHTNSHSRREVDLLLPIVKKIEFLRPMTALMDDDAIRNKRYEFKDRLDMGETLDDILPEAYAVVREATARVLHTPHYPEQLMGGIILHQGRVAQMCTGEGKTQTIILPAYLNAIEGLGVHVVTCNDYLSARDAEELRPVYESLGMTVGSVTKKTPQGERKAQYECDITYITNSELAFDYLRDNMAIYEEEKVQRGLHYCIIDEVDEVLIDQAKTPLRISGHVERDNSLYKPADEFVQTLERGELAETLNKLDYVFKVEAEDTGDYVYDEKNNRINLTEEGVKKAEAYFHIDNLADPENLEIRHHINLALRARYTLLAEVDYMVSDGQVLLIDKFTGRVMIGCKLSNGLHTALEVKEGLPISKAGITIANVTYQKFFNKYDKKGGLSGTAQTEETEFREVYFMDVVIVPTHRPIQRIDRPDALFRTKREKMKAVVDEVREAYDKRQPVLVGTPSVEASEEVSAMLKEAGIPHELLNARRLDQEADIVAGAGHAGKITVATNMAGRGTDIKIDEEARAAGGLKVIGTERFESRRIDDQLRGRSGRQGDVGESIFIISLEDELLQRHGSERMIRLFDAMDFPEGHRIEQKSMTRTIAAAQHNIETQNYKTRKNVADYDEVLNEQREIIYEERDRILTHDNIHTNICRLIEHVVNDAIDKAIGPDIRFADWDYDDLNRLLRPIIPLQPVTADRVELHDLNGLRSQLKIEALNLYEDRIQKYSQTRNMAEIEKVVLLKCIDTKWTRHIDDMDELKQGIHLQSYSGKDPLVQFKFWAYDMFDEMISDIREDAIYILYNAKFGREVKREQIARIVTGIDTDKIRKDDFEAITVDHSQSAPEKNDIAAMLKAAGVNGDAPDMLKAAGIKGDVSVLLKAAGINGDMSAEGISGARKAGYGENVPGLGKSAKDETAYEEEAPAVREDLTYTAEERMLFDYYAYGISPENGTNAADFYGVGIPENSDTGSAAATNADTGNAGAGSAGAGNAAAGNADTGNAGAGSAGAGNSAAGNAGTGNAGAGSAGAGNAAAGNAGKTPVLEACSSQDERTRDESGFRIYGKVTGRWAVSHTAG